MHPHRVPMRVLLAAAVAWAGLQAVPAEAVTAKKIPASLFLYRQSIGPYSKIQEPIAELASYLDENGIDGNIVGIYYDNPVRTAPALQKADLGVPIDEEEAMRLLREARPDVSEEQLLEQFGEELETDRGVMLADPYFIRYEPSALVAARRVSVPFGEFYQEYEKIQTWIWSNGYYLVGPVREVYFSRVGRNKVVRAEIQIGIERSGVPDRR